MQSAHTGLIKESREAGLISKITAYNDVNGLEQKLVLWTSQCFLLMKSGPIRSC